jgi:chromatin remodeling complex protein RSC6
MQNETNTKAEITALLEGRTQVRLENIRQFILDLDERDFMEFLYLSDPDFTEELETRNAEAKGMLETLREIEGTLGSLDRGKIKIQ